MHEKYTIPLGKKHMVHMKKKLGSFWKRIIYFTCEYAWKV